jgi:hypothetical protein
MRADCEHASYKNFQSFIEDVLFTARGMSDAPLAIVVSTLPPRVACAKTSRNQASAKRVITDRAQSKSTQQAKRQALHQGIQTEFLF